MQLMVLMSLSVMLAWAIASFFASSSPSNTVPLLWVVPPVLSEGLSAALSVAEAEGSSRAAAARASSPGSPRVRCFMPVARITAEAV